MNCSIYSKVMQGIAVLGFILAILLCKATSIDEISAYVSGMAEFKCDFQQNISSSRLIYTWEKQPSTTTSGISTVAELNKGERKYDYVTENYKKRFMVFMPNGDLNMYNITLEDKGYYDCPVREIKDDNTKEIRHHKKYLLKVFANYSVPEISNGSFQESEDETIVNFRCTSGDGFPQPRGILWMFSDYNGTKYYPIICKTESSPPCAIKETFQTFNISSYLTMTVKSTTNVSCTVLAHHNFSSEILQIELKNETTIPSEENNPHLKYIVPCIILISFFILAAVAYYCHRRTKKTCRSNSMPQELQPLRVSRPCLNLLLMTCLNLLHYNVEQERLRRRRRPKKIWVHPILQERTDKGHFNVLYQDLRSFPEKFKQFCRLNIIAFDRLLSLMSPDLDFQDTVMRRAISAEERLLITLRFLATGESYTSLHLQFRVGKSTISRIVRCTCTVIWQKLQPIVMPSPTEETWLQVAAGFQTVANFPNCIGAVDGKHVRVQQPPRSGSRFFNYKKFFSVVLMAVADAHFKFVAIDVGAYGSTGDSRVFRSSQIGLQILQDGVTLPAPRPLPGSTHPVPFVMVSDEAFPLQTNLLRPYPRRALNARRRIFNYRLSRARRYVECTFGIMCSQWRIFHTAIQLDTETVDTVIKACCVLHNYAREYSTEQDEESQLSELIPVVNSGQGRPSNSGARVRETFADYFMSPEGAVHWQYSCAGVEQPDQQRRSDEQ